VPKRGFTNLGRVEYAVVNLSQLARLAEEKGQTAVTPELLAARGLVHKGLPVKVLGAGELGAALSVQAHKFSKSARAKIEEAGGRCEELQA
jgi:large subunit ribosomal protein L15